MALKSYALWQSSKRYQNRQFRVQDETKIPKHIKLDTVNFTSSINNIYGYIDYNFVVYTTRDLDKAKLYKLFAQLKKESAKQENLERSNYYFERHGIITDKDVYIGADYERKAKKS